MSYRGDIRLGDTIDVKFSTVGTTGAPTTLAGTPVVSAYVGNSTTQITAGITLTVDFDGVTGMHNVRVVATSGNGFATQTNVDLVITTGTVGGTSVVGYVVGSFSIENRSALMPTTAARTLAVDASGRALGDLDTIKTQAVTAAAGVTFPTSIASPTNITAGTITTTTNLTNLPTIPANWVTAAGLAADAVAEIQSGLSTLDAAGVRTAVGLASANLDTQLGDLPTAVENADALLGRNVAGGSSSGRLVKEALYALRNKWTVSGGTYTVYATDDTTTSWTSTATGSAGADPIVASDPT